MHLWISFTPNAAVLFVDVAIQPEVHLIAKQNSLMKIGNNGNLVLGPFDESTPCLMIVLMNCQTKLRINHLTAVKSVAILESENASQEAEILSGVYCPDNVTANYLQFWLHLFRSGMPVIENVDKTTEIIEVDQHISSLGIAQELKIGHRTVSNHLHKAGFKKKLDMFG
ncbi:histone-lysine N-methyltransferase SETMAR [Trichonephila clavipes]|nr:histone-lysine N-methyltransferase SETMAR [Trichonephila clavipes]